MYLYFKIMINMFNYFYRNMNSKSIRKHSTTFNFNKPEIQKDKLTLPNVVEEEPDNKRACVDLNDSFYDEDQDDLISEACDKCF